jgi:tetratricopeptide (TPR) repeat protein
METNIQKQINWESISVFIFYIIVFLLPIFTLPFITAPLALSKSLLFYFGISLALFFWFLARLQKGEVKIPKSILLLATGIIAIVWFASSLFSSNPTLSLLGAGYEIDTLLFFLFMFFGLFLISIFFQSEKRVLIFYIVIFLAALVAFLFQFFHTIFRLDIIPLKIFPLVTSNLIGGWNDFAIFFGFVALVSLVLLEMFRFKKFMKVILLASVLLSLLAMMAVNFFIGWIIFGFFVLILFVYTFYKAFFISSATPSILRLSFFIFLAILFFILARGILGDFTTFLNTNTFDVRPSWSATADIIKQSIKQNPVLGSGPNTFLYDWLKFKPSSINMTLFWNTRFTSGIGHFPSMVATAGILGGLSLLAFLAAFLFYGLKVLSCEGNDLLRALLITSLLSSLYLWTFVVFYSPGFTIVALAFLSTGLLVAMLVRLEKIKVIELSFFKNPKAGFISVLAIVLLIFGSVSSLYFFAQKGRAAYFYDRAIKIFNTEGNLDKAENNLIKAVNLDSQDEYFRTLSELDLLKIQQLLSRTDLSTDELRMQFQNTLAAAIQNAQQSTKANPHDPLNWMQLGRVYESVVPLKIAGADAMAISSYEEALKYSPFDPTPFLASARVEIQAQKIKEARNYIQSALNLKGDFAAALLLLAQIEAQEGNLKEAIAQTEQTALLVPNDIGVLFQLGLLYYQDNNLEKSRFALERAVSLDENYANARYFLGLVYDTQGMKSKAIEQFENIVRTNPENQEVQKILSNLRAGRKALEEISPPAKLPEERETPPIEEKEEKVLKKK